MRRRPAGLTLYVYGYPADVVPGVSVFSEPWDLDSAVKLSWGNTGVRAYPIVQGVKFACGPAAMYPAAIPAPWDALQGGYGPPQGSPYGLAVLVDARRSRSWLVTDRRSCRRRTAHLALAPVAEQVPSSSP